MKKSNKIHNIIPKEVLYMKEFIVKRRKNYVQFTCRIEEDMLEEIKHIVLD